MIDKDTILFINNYIYKLYNNIRINDSAISTEDLQQEGLLAALEAESRYDPTAGASRRSWLITNALRGVQAYLGSQIGTVRIPRRARAAGEEIEYEATTWLLDAHEDYIPDELYLLLLTKCFNLLSELDAQLVLEYFGITDDSEDKTTIRSMSESYDLPRNTVHTRIKRSINILQQDATIRAYYDALR